MKKRAKATVTFTDKPNGTVGIRVDFEPSVTGHTDSAAQQAAMLAIELLTAEIARRGGQ